MCYLPSSFKLEVSSFKLQPAFPILIIRVRLHEIFLSPWIFFIFGWRNWGATDIFKTSLYLFVLFLTDFDAPKIYLEIPFVSSARIFHTIPLAPKKTSRGFSRPMGPEKRAYVAKEKIQSDYYSDAMEFIPQIFRCVYIRQHSKLSLSIPVYVESKV